MLRYLRDLLQRKPWISGVCTFDGLSDHDIVHFEVNLKARRSSQCPQRVYVYKKPDFRGLNKFIAKSSSKFFASNPCENSVEQNWNAFKYAVTTGISQFIPQKSSNPKNKLPWINPEIKREMRKKDRLYKKATHSKNQ